MLDDLFEIAGNHRKHHGNGHGHEHGHGHRHDSYHEDSHENPSDYPFRGDHAYRRRSGHDLWDPQLILTKLMHNKQLLAVLAVAAIVFLISIAVALFMLLPLLYKIFALVESNGLKGIADSILAVAGRIWEGKEALSVK